MSGEVVDVSAVIDRSRFSPRQITIIALCGALMIIDGYDSGELAFIAPNLIRDWHLQPSMLTLLFTVSGLCQIAASIFFGPLADRYGRRWLIIGCTAFTGLMSLAGAYAVGPFDFLVWRCLCALGLAPIMTNAVALGAEYAPARARSFSVIALYCGFSIGQIVGAAVASHLIPLYGWRIVLIIGGVIPILFALLCVPWLPESIRFLALTRPKSPAIAKELERIVRDRDWTGDLLLFMSSEKPATKRPIRELFIEGRAVTTLLVWIVFLMNITGLIFLNSWVPTLLHSAEIPIPSALRVAMMMQVGTLAGALIMAWCMDRYRPFRVLIPAHLIGVTGLIWFGQEVGPGNVMFLAALTMGAGVLGAQIGMIGFTASLYPTSIRATGVGWAFGIGRFGSIIGPLFGGMIISLHVPIADAFIIGAGPAVIATLSLVGLAMLHRPPDADAARAPVAEPLG